MSRRWSLVAVVASAACFGTLPVMTRLAYDAHATPLPLLAWRFMFAAALLAIVSVARRASLVVPGRDVLRFGALAVTGYGAASICYFFALKFADASVVAVLLYAYPAFVTLASWLLLGERATWQRGAAVMVTFLGCALVVGLLGGATRAQWQGIALGLGAALGYTLFNLLSHRWLPGRSQLVMMTYTFGIASIMAGAIALGAGQSLSAAAWEPRAWWLMAGIVAIPTFAAIVLYLEGIRGLGPAQAAVVSTVEPLFTIALAAVFLPEQTLTPVQLAGAGLVLAGVVWAEVSARSTETIKAI